MYLATIADGKKIIVISLKGREVHLNAHNIGTKEEVKKLWSSFRNGEGPMRLIDGSLRRLRS